MRPELLEEGDLDKKTRGYLSKDWNFKLFGLQNVGYKHKRWDYQWLPIELLMIGKLWWGKRIVNGIDDQSESSVGRERVPVSLVSSSTDIGRVHGDEKQTGNTMKIVI